ELGSCLKSTCQACSSLTTCLLRSKVKERGQCDICFRITFSSRSARHLRPIYGAHRRARDRFRRCFAAASCEHSITEKIRSSFVYQARKRLSKYMACPTL